MQISVLGHKDIKDNTDDFICKNRQSNVAIFPNVVQAYTLFDTRIKLIICRIRHELSVTIHKISISWKKKR